MSTPLGSNDAGAVPDAEIDAVVRATWAAPIADVWWDRPVGELGGATPRQLLAAGHRDELLDHAIAKRDGLYD